MFSQSSARQSLTLMALRISLGMLLVWWGLSKIVKPGMGDKVQDKFYFGLFPGETIQFTFGFVELGIGLCVVLGIFRKYVVIAQLMITGFSAMTIWSALLDPFALWLPVSKIAGFQHLFYPTVIALCGATVLISFRHLDRFSLDAIISNRQKKNPNGPFPAE